MKLPLLPFLSFIAVFAFAGLSCDRHSFDDTAQFFNEEDHGEHEGDDHAKEGKHAKEGEHAKEDKKHEKPEAEKKH